METSSVDVRTEQLVDWVTSSSFRDISGVGLLKPVKYAGSSGNGKSGDSLLSIRLIAVIVGLSSGFSCTQRRPTWIHLKASDFE